MKMRLRWVAPVAFCALCAGCNTTPKTPPKQKLIVFAAASLTEVVDDFERDFETTHPNIDVQTTFSGSHILSLHIQNGAPADVFISADQTHMKRMLLRGEITDEQPIAHNELAVIVPMSNPAKIERFKDLTKASRIVLGAPNAPIGHYTQRLFEKMNTKLGPKPVEHIRAQTVSQENNTRLVRMKLELEQADAAIVYRTDGLSSERVRTVSIPADLNVRTTCWAGVVARTKQAQIASLFVRAMTSKQGKDTLRQRGFVAGDGL